MDFQGLISILALIVAAMGAYYAREQVMLIRQAQLSTSRNVQTSPPCYFRNPTVSPPQTLRTNSHVGRTRVVGMDTAFQTSPVSQMARAICSYSSGW